MSGFNKGRVFRAYLSIVLPRQKLVQMEMGTQRHYWKSRGIVTEGQDHIESNECNTITRNVREGDPAVKIARKGNDVVKLAHELNSVKSGELFFSSNTNAKARGNN
ncbi:hypothetical protein EDB87DRAFT_1578259 [Lactarius vividus]|nr:hypothetical protein EDB87DRAFT_1578259 [Lactarius vividus]